MRKSSVYRDYIDAKGTEWEHVGREEAPGAVDSDVKERCEWDRGAWGGGL